MSTIARKIAASPKRTATETWEVIVGLIVDQSNVGRKVLETITGVVAAIISDEILGESPLIIIGSGPRVKIYCAYGESALSQNDCNEDSLLQKPVQDDWKIYIPCNTDDLEWINSSLARVSSFVFAYDKSTEPNIENNRSASQKLTFNKNEFLNNP